MESTGPHSLKATLLSQASTRQQSEFAKMLAEQCAEAEMRKAGHRCWMFVPTRDEYELMAKYAIDDTCPKCGKGRVVLEVFKDGMGESYWLKCYFGDGSCDFKESATLKEA